MFSRTWRAAAAVLVAIALQFTVTPAGASVAERPVASFELAKLARIRRCESGGNYRAVSRSGKYRGAYQFDRRTWAGVGGHGDPAAASPAEQDARALRLLRRSGPGRWPVCGRR